MVGIDQYKFFCEIAVRVKIIFSSIVHLIYFERGIGGASNCQYCVNEDSDRDSVEEFWLISMKHVDQPSFMILAVESIQNLSRKARVL